MVVISWQGKADVLLQALSALGQVVDVQDSSKRRALVVLVLNRMLEVVV